METGIYVRRDRDLQRKERERAAEDGVSNIGKITEKEKKVDCLLKCKSHCIL